MRLVALRVGFASVRPGWERFGGRLSGQLVEGFRGSKHCGWAVGAQRLISLELKSRLTYQDERADESNKCSARRSRYDRNAVSARAPRSRRPFGNFLVLPLVCGASTCGSHDLVKRWVWAGSRPRRASQNPKCRPSCSVRPARCRGRAHAATVQRPVRPKHRSRWCLRAGSANAKARAMSRAEAYRCSGR